MQDKVRIWIAKTGQNSVKTREGGGMFQHPSIPSGLGKVILTCFGPNRDPSRGLWGPRWGTNRSPFQRSDGQIVSTRGQRVKGCRKCIFGHHKWCGIVFGRTTSDTPLSGPPRGYVGRFSHRIQVLDKPCVGKKTVDLACILGCRQGNFWIGLPS